MIDEWKLDYDRRQYLLMIDRIEAFRRSEIEIDILIASLKGLLSTLEVRDEQWIDRVIDEWGQLEILYALACEEAEAEGVDTSVSIKELSNSPAVIDATSRIDALVHERLGQL